MRRIHTLRGQIQRSFASLRMTIWVYATKMRIFIGIDLDPEVRERIARFLEGIEGFAPEARWVRPGSLHITLKFIGEQTPEQVAAIAERLRRVESGAFDIRFGGY